MDENNMENKGIDSETFESGSTHSDSNQSGSYQSDSYQSEPNQSGSYQSGSYQSGSYQSGTYENNSFDGERFSDTPYYTDASSANSQSTTQDSKALEICALVFGVLGIICCVCFGIPGIIGLILSIVCLAKGKKSGFAIGGLICSIIGIIATIIFIVSLIFAGKKDSDIIYDDTTEYTFTVTEGTVPEGLEDEITTEVEDDEDTQATTEASVPTPVEGLSDFYADLDNRSFAINGKVYTLGVTTLQDMIDDGVPFDVDDIANANNNLDANSSSQGFKIILGDYYSAQIYVGNFTDENKTIAECPICEIYLPVDLDEPNDILQFAFPLTITEEELVANSGEPTDKNEYTSDDGQYQSNTYEYKVDSTQYIGDSGYTFEFTNGQLRYVYIDLK
ncbi:MAG: hypothetical protein ACI4F4_08695 [Lachnospiraceae bacterium]